MSAKPKAGVTTATGCMIAAKGTLHSNSSSIWACDDGEIVNPSIFAVFELLLLDHQRPD